MINRFVLNEVSYFGPGAREVLPQEINRLGLHKAFVSTDKDLLKFRCCRQGIEGIGEGRHSIRNIQ